MLTLYFSPGSSSMAVHIALHEIGADFERRLVSLAKGEQHKPEYLEVNPEAKVPTLLIDGRPLTEVAAILYFLAKRFPDAGLWPFGGLSATYERLMARPAVRQTIEIESAIGYALPQ